MSIWAPVIGTVLIAVLSIVGQLLTTRNDRALTQQQLDILDRLEPSSQAAEDLKARISLRLASSPSETPRAKAPSTTYEFLTTFLR